MATTTVAQRPPERGPTTALVVCRIPVPEPTFDKFEQQARQSNSDALELMAERLVAAADRNDQKPLYFSDEQRRDLEKLLNQNLGGPQAALAAVRRCVEMSVSGVRVQLPPEVTQRLSTRLPDGTRWEDYIANLVRSQLEEYVGL